MKREAIIIIIAVLIAAVAIWYFFFNGSGTSTGSSGTKTGGSGTSSIVIGGGVGTGSSEVFTTAISAAEVQYGSWIAYAKSNGLVDNNNDGYSKYALYHCRVDSQLTNLQLQYLARKYNKGTIV
jgi:hypothetical protein